jgi:hypothetical protein
MDKLILIYIYEEKTQAKLTFENGKEFIRWKRYTKIKTCDKISIIKYKIRLLPP